RLIKSPLGTIVPILFWLAILAQLFFVDQFSSRQDWYQLRWRVGVLYDRTRGDTRCNDGSTDRFAHTMRDAVYELGRRVSVIIFSARAFGDAVELFSSVRIVLQSQTDNVYFEVNAA